MLLSVCIPLYNRIEVLPALLDSIIAQHDADFEIVLTEDGSPQRAQIARVVADYQARYPGLIRYFENPVNLGFDGNLRRLFELAQGEYCLFMGNDDLLCAGALQVVTSALTRYPDVGAIMRSYATFTGDPPQVLQEFRYFPDERFFPAGTASIVTFFRRMVVIPGIVLHRASALQCATDRFDGTLLYQLYVTGNILAQRNGVFLPEILALYRTGGVPDFGNSAAEKEKFVPGDQTPESSLHFMRGFLRIAQGTEDATGLPVYKPILQDLSNYSYGFIAVQRNRSVRTFLSYCASLARLGFGRSPLFYVYVLGLLLLGTRRANQLITWIKQRRGYTPALGRVYDGQAT